MAQRSGTELQWVRREQPARPTVLVIGDLVCDVYMVGQLVEQGAAPVFSASATYDSLSGAADTACDLQALGCDVRLLSVVGADAVGRRTRELLRQQCIPDTLVLEDIGRPTAQRTHLRGQQGPVLCLERRRLFTPSRALASRMLECANAVLPEVDGVLCAEGTMDLCDADLERLLESAQSAGCQVYVGSHGSPAERRWSRCSGLRVHSGNGGVSLAQVAQDLQQQNAHLSAASSSLSPSVD